jgi:hypothetical protein
MMPCNDRRKVGLQRQNTRKIGVVKERVVSTKPRPLYPWKNPVPFLQEDKRSFGPLWKRWKSTESTAHRDLIQAPSNL